MRLSSAIPGPARRLAGGLWMLVVLTGIETMSAEQAIPTPAAKPLEGPSGAAEGGLEKATFGAGCFWCVEAVFQRLKGVESAVSGYSGGRVKNPTYKQVCTGRTGHAEVVQVTFDPKQITYAELLQVFWATHDPTTRNRQGADVGTQYRSVVFHHTDQQRQVAEAFKRKIDAAGLFRAPVVTEIEPFDEFFPAENYHQEYYELNARQPYCQTIIRPKVEKLKSLFGDKLKEKAQQ